MERYLKPLAWATLIANCGIVVTGAVVRLTGSGLGCPTWPRCTEESFVPHGAIEYHSVIEFGNRLLTYVLAAIAIATFLAAWRTGRRELRILALVIALGIPAQAVVGGVTVLTGLNPWVVAGHLLISMAIICLAVRLLLAVDGPLPPARRDPVSGLAWTIFGTGWVVLYLGTVVTGSGPHAGDLAAPRNQLDPLRWSQLHADAVFLFLGLTVGLLFAALAVRRTAVPAVATLLGIELAQGAIGFVQYFTGLPAVLVGFHMLGAATIAASMTWALLRVRSPQPISGSSATETKSSVR